MNKKLTYMGGMKSQYISVTSYRGGRDVPAYLCNVIQWVA